MKAISLREPERFEMIDIDPPAQPAPGEALVQVHNIGICGTDVSGYFGKMPLMSYPRILGHELGVEVLAVGDGVSNVAPGDRCAVEPYLNCVDRCIACRRGAPNCCTTLEVLGVHTDGGMRPQFLLPARKLHVSTQLAFEQLALVETLGIGAHAVDRGAPGAADAVLIIGAGPIGLATFEFARLTGATTIFMDLNQERLRFAREVMHCDHTLVAQGDIVAQLRDLTDGDLPNVVFDATGSNVSMAQAVNYIAPTGCLVFVGLTAREVSFPHMAVHRPETSCCTRCHFRAISRCRKTSAAGIISLDRERARHRHQPVDHPELPAHHDPRSWLVDRSAPYQARECRQRIAAVPRSPHQSDRQHRCGGAQTQCRTSPWAYAASTQPLSWRAGTRPARRRSLHSADSGSEFVYFRVARRESSTSGSSPRGHRHPRLTA